MTLMRIDAAADWQRIWLHFREPDAATAGRYQDPSPHADDSWNGRPVTGTCARALHAAVALADRSVPSLLPIPAGVLALCLVGEPTTAASRALGATSEPAHSLLLELMQEVLVQGGWADIKAVLWDSFDLPASGPSGRMDDEDLDVRRFVDYHAGKFQALVESLNQFLRADTPDLAGALLERHPELLSPVFEAIVAKSIGEATAAGDHAGARQLREKRRFLEGYRRLVDRPPQEIAGTEHVGERGRPTGSAASEPSHPPRSGHSSQRSALETRLRHVWANPDPGTMLDPAATAEAAELLASAADLRTDFQLLKTAGALHFLRWTAHQDAENQDDEDGQEDLLAAMALFAPLLDTSKNRLPKPIRKFLTRERKQRPRPGSPPATIALYAFLTAEQPAAREWAELLWQLSLVLYRRYERVRQTPLLSEAIALLRHAVKATASDDPGYSRRAASLGTWLLVLHEQTRQPADLDEAMEILRPALADIPDERTWRPGLFSALGSALHGLFTLDSDLDALDAAIRAHRDALRDLPAGDPRYGPLALRLAAALLRHHERTRQLASLDEAIERLQAAQVAVTRHAERTPALLTALSNNLSVAFTTRYEHTGDESDLNDAIDAGQRAVSAAEDTTDRAAAHGTLGMALLARYVRYASPGPANFLTDPTVIEEILDDYLDDALEHLRTAVALSPADGPQHATALANLGIGLLRARAAGAPSDALRAASDAFGQAADSQSAAPSVRTRASLAAGRLAADRGDWHAATDRLAAAIDLLAEAMPRALRREDREYQLSQVRDLGCDAAACAWRDGDTERAVALLELGRGVLLAQEMGAPVELARLSAHDSELADSFGELWLAAERAGTGDLISGVSDWTVQTAAEQRRTLLRRWDDLLAQIRDLPGFEDFPRPPRQANLLASGREGPVALINVSTYGSAAFLIRDGGVTSIGLPDLTPATVRAMVTELLAATDPEDMADPERSQQRLDHLLGWLWDTVTGPVLDHLGLTARLSPGAAPRIWWCPSGLLSFLPLHAAGHHSTRSDARPLTVMDRVISSYIPTIRMLEHTRQAPARTVGSTLIVAAGSIGTVDLTSGVTVLAGAAATPDAVLSALRCHGRVHFACHAASNLSDPSTGYLELHDQQHLAVADVAALRLVHAEFAFLAACATYQGGTTLADEAIHLGGAFHLAGYRHVVATLWPIHDSPTAARITQAVHQSIAGAAGVAATAASLHEATRQHRDRAPHAPSLWAPYVHSGSLGRRTVETRDSLELSS
ncbi:MAG TPA: CHAT domain-containing protein [Streptosporangiaceae bacterium]|nr:CHAT domain-containing protein [Streptosporangiaceae bacterium]